MNILVTGANGQLGNEIRIISKDMADRFVFTDVSQVEGRERIPTAPPTPMSTPPRRTPPLRRS